MENSYGQEGRIIRVVGGLYTVALDGGVEGSPLSGQTVECRARGNFRHEGMTPLVGDLVTVSYDDGSFDVGEDGVATPRADATGMMLASIAPRRNSLIRPPLANVDLMLVVLASAAPAPDTATIDKLLCILEYNRIEPVLVIGKSELDPDRAEELRALYESVGYRVFVLSCHTGEGIEAFSHFAHTETSGRITAVAGASGVGKSTLLTTVFKGLGGRDGKAPASGDISRKIARGKNTTRHTELFPIPDSTGYIADTAGFSLLDFQRFDFFRLDDLAGTFREFEPYLGCCRYTDCTHLCEEGCAVVDAVKAKEIAPSRHSLYRELYAVLKEKPSWEKKN